MNTAHEFLDRTCVHHASRPAILFEGRSITYGELRARVNRLAAALAGRGVRRRERVCLFLGNIPEFAVSYYATLKLGATVVALNSTLKHDEVLYALNDSQSMCLITERDLLPHVPARKETPALRFAVAVGGGDGAADFAAFEAGGAGAVRTADLERDETAAILYTSGTTGKSKGAMLTHGNLVSNVHAAMRAVGARPEDRYACFLPLFHCFGQNFIMNGCFGSGATLVLHRRFVPDEVLASLRQNEVSIFFGVPTIFFVLLGLPAAPEAFQSVRYAFSAASILPVDVFRRFRDAFGLVIHEGYGLTESSPFASYNHWSHHREGTVGTPIENVEMKIVDSAGSELPADELGEIVIRGPNVMKGYFNRPEETAQCMLPGGWLRSGDIGRVDEDGYFSIVDRVKDIIITGGFNVYPREVEEVLFQHAAVKEAAVIGIPDEAYGEVVKAFVVRKAGAATATEEEIIGFCRDKMSVMKVPKVLEFVDAVPKSATGKILKKDLRKPPA